MNSLVLPNKVVIKLLDKHLLPVRLAGVLFNVRLFARHKDNFTLGPYASDGDGLVTILREEIDAEINANYDSGWMNYGRVSDCVPAVEIRLLSEDDIHRAVEARKKVWKDLLAGERDRWSSMEQLLTVYESAKNVSLLIDESTPIRDEWDEDGAEYSYNCVVVPR
jgi:hypothetical protein